MNAEEHNIQSCNEDIQPDSEFCSGVNKQQVNVVKVDKVDLAEASHS